MARPQKDGLEYFPVVTSFDDKINLIIAEFGPEGLGIIIGLYQKIYTNGYYMEWNEDALMLFATRHINAEKTRVNDVLMRSFDRNIFNRELYEQYGILTSSGIQKQYLKVCKDCRRKSVQFIKEYCLIKPNDKLFEVITELIPINTEITPSNSVKTQQNDVENTQRERERKEKEKESKEKENVSETETLSPNPQAIELVAYYENLKPGQSISAHIGFLTICLEKYGLDWTKEAIRVCVSNKNRFIKPYVEKILMYWKEEGGPSTEKQRGQPSGSGGNTLQSRADKNIADAMALVEKYSKMDEEMEGET